MKLHNALGFVGVGLLGGALWAIHPAVTIGFVGVIVIACSVWLARKAKA